MTHPRITGEIYNRYTLQSQRPRRQQVEPAVPREIVDSRGGFEEDNRRACSLRCAQRNLICHVGDFQVIQPSNKSAFNTLREKIFKPANHYSLLSNIYSLFSSSPLITLLVPQSHQQIPGHIQEQLLMFLGEILTPAAGLPRTECVRFPRLDCIRQDR